MDQAAIKKVRSLLEKWGEADGIAVSDLEPEFLKLVS